jgi:2-keto-3-deoxy-L-rhamnonate aldolase RhmA
MIINYPLKLKLKEKPYVLGSFISSTSSLNVEAIALSGVDFIIIDTEHASPSYETVENMIRAAEIYNVGAIVRITDYDPKAIGRLLDIGAHGIQVPMVHTAERAKEVVRAAKYAPLGERGMATGRAARWGKIENFRDSSNNTIVTVCMCETKQAVENMEKIVKTPGLDIVFIGANDLSQSLGCPGQTKSPIVEECVLKVHKICQDSGIISGIVTGSVEEARKRIQQGFRYISVMNDLRILADSATNRIMQIRES